MTTKRFDDVSNLSSYTHTVQIKMVPYRLKETKRTYEPIHKQCNNIQKAIESFDIFSTRTVKKVTKIIEVPSLLND